MVSYITIFLRRRIFHEHHDDPSYMPLPEDRPGGFNWGQPQPAAADAVADDEAVPRDA